MMLPKKLLLISASTPPTLREAVDGIASNVVDKPRDRRLVLVGSALMRRYHLVYLTDQQGSVEQISPLEL